MTADAARLAPGVGGSPFTGRVSLPLDGETKFHDVTASSLPFDQPCLVAPCTNAKHGGRGRRGWRKLHLGVDGSRVIVACALTEPTADDAITGISLVDEVDGHLTRVTADPAYDTRAFYGAAGARGARVVVPPTKTASLSRRGARSGARDRTIRRVQALGRRRWKKASGYHQHARVENAFFRYTSIVGDCLRARSSSGQRREAVLACNVLNRMTELGRPVSYRIGR